jgi:hypothetical protein
MLCHVITYIQEEMENKKVALGAFLDIEGAFHSTSRNIIIKAAKQHGLEDMICWWIGSKLGNRKITAHLQEHLSCFLYMSHSPSSSFFFT